MTWCWAASIRSARRAATSPRVAALVAGYGDHVPGMQINRFCASGLDAVNFAAAQVMSGQHDMAVGGGVESMSRVGIGASGGAWAMDPAVAIPTYFMPQGISADLIATKYGFSRDDVDAYAVESQKRAAAGMGARAASRSRSCRSGRQRPHASSTATSTCGPTTEHAVARRAEALLRAASARMGGFDAVAIQKHPEVEAINHVHHAGNSSGIVDGAAAVLIGSQEAGKQSRPEAARANPRLRQYRLRAGDHADRPGRRDQEGAEARRHEASRTSICSSSTRPSPRSCCASCRRSRSITTKVNVNGGAIAHGPSARRDRRDDPRHRARRTGAHRQADRAGHALHRRRHGHRDDHRARLSRRAEQVMNLKKLQLRDRRRRHRACDLGHAGPSMNVITGSHRRARRVIDKVAARRRDQGLRRHVGQGHVLRPAPISRCWRSAASDYAKARQGTRRRSGDALLRRRCRHAVAALPQARDLRQAVGRGDQRHLPRRRLRTGARLPLSRRCGRSRRRASACRKSRSVCSRAPAAPNAFRG